MDNVEAFIKAMDTINTQLYKMGKTLLKNDEDIGDAIQETILTAYEKLPTLKEAIQSLDEKYKIVISLYYIMGFSLKEICSILNEKEGTIKSRLCRGRNALRKFYNFNEEVN